MVPTYRRDAGSGRGPFEEFLYTVTTPTWVSEGRPSPAVNRNGSPSPGAVTATFPFSSGRGRQPGRFRIGTEDSENAIQKYARSEQRSSSPTGSERFTVRIGSSAIETPAGSSIPAHTKNSLIAAHSIATSAKYSSPPPPTRAAGFSLRGRCGTDFPVGRGPQPPHTEGVNVAASPRGRR